MEPITILTFVTISSFIVNFINNKRIHLDLLEEIRNLKCELFIMKKNIQTIKSELEKFS